MIFLDKFRMQFSHDHFFHMPFTYFLQLFHTLPPSSDIMGAKGGALKTICLSPDFESEKFPRVHVSENVQSGIVLGFCNVCRGTNLSGSLTYLMGFQFIFFHKQGI